MQKGMSLLAARGVLVLSERGLVTLPAANVTAEAVGHKALGLAFLPELWALPVLVIDRKFVAATTDEQAKSVMSEAYLRIGHDQSKPVIVRSSGIDETLEQRGRLLSRVCKSGEVFSAIQALVGELKPEVSSTVHWIVQSNCDARCKGHLSNERRLRRENRDWVAEFEPQASRRGYATPVAVRTWRDGGMREIVSLECSSEAQVSVRLKRVAMWAMQFESRLHFEWIWDGSRVIIVQADAENLLHGHDPMDAILVEVPAAEVRALSAFRTAQASDFDTYAKLRNARIYRDLGYEMPPFFVLTDVEVIAEVLVGVIRESLMEDIRRLTLRPLIIRTDGLSIPRDRREMLPRSDELRSAEEAISWLVGTFRDKILGSNLAECQLALLAHHFVPAAASAWALAEPGAPLVRVESLWGIPEGLYWYAHDTFQVDTKFPSAKLPATRPKEALASRERLRYKGSFVAPNTEGTFVHRRTSSIADWSRSIRKQQWLSEIAWNTRRIAEVENRPICVMWFADTHAAATKHRVLPWFHDAFALGELPKAAPRNKLRSAAECRIESAQDWADLLSALASKKLVERIVVEPTDPSLLRDQDFALQLAKVANEFGIVVELSGGILSHAYYILSRNGVKVECVDLFGSDEDVVEFDKLIRDKVPDGIELNGERVETVRLTGGALVLALQQKLVEEALEAFDAQSGEEMIAEMADVLEVIEALASALGESRARVEGERTLKLRRRGGFSTGTMLLRTSTPGTLRGQEKKDDELAIPLQPRSVSDPGQLPGRPKYRRPDLRLGEKDGVEKILTIEVDLARLNEPVRESLQFEFPRAANATDSFSLTLEVKRHESEIRTVARVRRNNRQLELPLQINEGVLAETPVSSASEN